MSFKKNIRKIIPVRASVFEKYKEDQRKHNAEILKQNQEILKRFDAQAKQMAQRLDALSKQNAELKNQNVQLEKLCDRIYSANPDSEKLNTRWEHKVLGPFREVLFGDDFGDKFLALAKGMDNGSIHTLATIVKRQRQILETEEDTLDVFSAAEKRKLHELRWRLKNEVVKIADDVFCFDGYLLPIGHFEASVFVYRHGIDELDNPEYFKDKDILDVGGFIGDSAIVFSPLTTGRVITFEGSKENFEVLERTVELNGSQNIVAEQMALGASSGYLDLSFNGSMTSADPICSDDAKYAEQVPMMSLDEYASTHDLNIGLIKVDIEGYEQEFLKGAKKTIEEQRPILLMSIYHNPEDFYGIKPLIESWNLGYTFKIHKPVDNTTSREVLLLAEPPYGELE